MTLLPFLVFAILAGAWYLSTKIMHAALDTLQNPMNRIRPRSLPPSEPLLKAPLAQTLGWAEGHGFAEDIMFDFQIAAGDQSLFCQTWKKVAERTYLVFYFGLGRNYVELVTIYDDNTGVTTTNAPDAHTLPAAPGAFIQSFPGMDLPKLQELHQQGCRTLERRTGLEPQDRPEGTLDLIVTSLTRQARYITSIPGWRWKGIWWMTVRKQRMLGKDVAWQLDQFGVYEPVAPSSEIMQ